MLPYLGHKLAHVVNLKRRKLDIYLQSAGITRPQCQVLLMLHVHGDGTQKNLLGQLDMDPAQLARTLDALEKDGYVTRRPWQENRRCMFVQMTELCRNERMPGLLAAMNSVEQQMFLGFSEEEHARMHAMLDKMNTNLQPDEEQ
ncbi:MarR family winged helix-turn-helix transcriptional regulator [Silvimonas iriomotensis]|uniref:HTH marR-type domain-containing protein n=1 Tax=Silvimonas iriomotensis TaxID=449662 RepID=A0ABQ2PA48_9NEIS|nr:MarR family transcriptional regulator [Silvimonas iriomotensis]GGP21561.1 hypothetical protein GCM10010970_21090 [Silvimonas iriomotensis]